MAEASEMRLLQQHRKITSAAASKKKQHATMVFSEALWNSVELPTVPPTG
jgi:hypothetical protein